MLTIGVFRLQLFKSSETFIVSQVGAVKNFLPKYLGRVLFNKPPKGVEVILPRVSGLHYIFSLAKFYIFGSPDIFLSDSGVRDVKLIHAHFAIDGVFATSLAKKLNIPLVTTLHGFDVTRTDLNMLLAARPALIHGVLFRRRLTQYCQVFLCVSDAIRERAILRGFPPDRCITHYIGFDVKKFSGVKRVEERGHIVHVGRLVEKKGATYLLKAFAGTLKNFPDSKLSIIGDGPLKQELQMEALMLGIESKVAFLGALPNEEVLNIISTSAMLVVPSVTARNGDMEGLPTVILEAAAQGVPVVAFASSGIGEAVIHGKTGLLAAEKDFNALRVHMESLLSDDDYRARMGRDAQDFALKNFDIDFQTGKLEAIYSRVIGADI